METPVILSLPLEKGKSQREIVQKTQVPRKTVRRIFKQEHSRRERKKKYSKSHL
ncbi:uncharacterized protein LY89DRAFT_683193, partial [Mollisia scopiformis]